jgi:hypothetical protein
MHLPPFFFYILASNVFTDLERQLNSNFYLCTRRYYELILPEKSIVNGKMDAAQLQF